jgi:hypothetical protein
MKYKNILKVNTTNAVYYIDQKGVNVRFGRQYNSETIAKYSKWYNISILFIMLNRVIEAD